MSFKSTWCIVLLKSSVSLLIFYLDVLACIEGEVMNSPAIIVLLPISPFSLSMFALHILVL